MGLQHILYIYLSEACTPALVLQLLSREGNIQAHKMVSCKDASFNSQIASCIFKVNLTLYVIVYMFFLFTCVYLLQATLENDINQHFQDAIDVIEHNSYYSGAANIS